MTTEKDAMHEALRKTELALAEVLHAADFIRDSQDMADSASSGRGGKRSKLRDGIINCIRKLRINRELGEYYYVAVAGGQSAGKTRLIRELYGLDDQWLPDNEGRGERLPVFIIETPGIDKPFATQVVLDPKTRVTREEEIDHEEFQTLVRGIHPNAHALYPKLHVPRRHFPDAQLGFVLLPGFEIVNDANTSWQEVMRHTLQHALGCLFVTDKTQLAGSQQLEMQRVSREKFGGREFAIAISKTETLSLEQREALRRTAFEVFNLMPDQHDQVVCTGTEPAFVAQWSAELIAALDANSRSAATSFELRLNDLSDIAENDIDGILAELDRQMLRGSVRQTAATSHRDEIMQLFEDASGAYRSRLEKELGGETRKLAASIGEEAVTAYIDEEEGFENTAVKGIKRFFNTTSGERERIHLDRIFSRWRAEDLTVSDFAALSRIASDRLDIPFSESLATAEALSHDPVRALGYENLSNEARAAVVSDSKAVRGYMVRLLKADKAKELTPIDAEDRGDLETAIRLIPALTMEYLRINQAVAFVATKGDSSIQAKLETQSLGEVLQATVEGLPRFKDATTNLLRTVGCILAVDVAIDGTVDTIPGLMHAIFGGGSAAAATGLGATLSMAAAGVIMLGYVGYQATTAAQRADAAHRGFIRSAVSDLAARHVDRWMGVYDDAMERVTDRLRESLNRAYNIDTHVANNDALLRAMTQLEMSRLNLVRNLGYAKHSLV